ncbi:response regulator transcription factor [Rhodoferax sediminis]|uniref:Response regulator transcription factor n=1 Tax=Rhodoferax sediminis TaxID=2509614 RepID=A0A515D7L5_9BURK|nr:response regulator transcription factor [Rhodoferax sediminis]QDL36405.1 response regulator transcription factor [Rhodoferax sediminis]
MRLLIVEDNPDILANLYGFLEPLGYVLDSARNGSAGLALASKGTYDAIVLDLMLPGLDGLDVCGRLRAVFGCATPVLILTARDTVEDKVAGFGCGADDYLVKPFSMIELEVRLKALIRRARGNHVTTALRVGALTFDPATFQATRAGTQLQLTPTGYKLLAALMRAAPAVVSRDNLEREVWGDDRPDSDALRTHIHSLRVVLDKPFAIPMLKTLPGIGYRLTAAQE